MAGAERDPVDQALDLLVYAPLGLALTARDELPRMIQRGRLEAQGRITLARMVGQIAVAQGQKEAGRLFDGLFGRGSGSAEAPSQPASSAPTPPEPAPSPPRRNLSLSSEDLAIPGYDSLSASQVVSRLAGLSPEELTAVGDYEAASRSRRTILNRVAQLKG